METNWMTYEHLSSQRDRERTKRRKAAEEEAARLGYERPRMTAEDHREVALRLELEKRLRWLAAGGDAVLPLAHPQDEPADGGGWLPCCAGTFCGPVRGGSLGAEEGPLWPPVRSIASEKMHHLTKLSADVGGNTSQR